MAYFRRYFRRRYRRYYKKKAVKTSNQYLRVRVDKTYQINFPQNQNGQPGFVINNELHSKLTVNDVLANSTYYQEMKTMWGYSKLTGVAVMVMPGSCVRQSGEFGYALAVGFMYGQPYAENFNSLMQADSSLLANPFSTVRKYNTVKGSNWWYSTNNEGGTGSFYCYSDQNKSRDANQSYLVKLSLYMTLSKSNL